MLSTLEPESAYSAFNLNPVSELAPLHKGSVASAKCVDDDGDEVKETEGKCPEKSKKNTQYDEETNKWNITVVVTYQRTNEDGSTMNVEAGGSIVLPCQDAGDLKIWGELSFSDQTEGLPW